MTAAAHTLTVRDPDKADIWGRNGHSRLDEITVYPYEIAGLVRLDAYSPRPGSAGGGTASITLEWEDALRLADLIRRVAAEAAPKS